MTSQTKTKVYIRLASKYDNIAPKLLEISEESFPYGSPWTLEQFEQILSQKHVFTLLAYIDEEICGFLCGGINPFEAEIYNIATASEYKNIGIGMHLLNEMKYLMKVNQIQNSLLEVRQSNLRAMSVYKKAGFYPVGRRKDYYKSPEEDAIILKSTSTERA